MHYLIYFKNTRIVFLVDIEQVFYKSFLVENLFLLFVAVHECICKSGLLHFFTKVTS